MNKSFFCVLYYFYKKYGYIYIDIAIYSHIIIHEIIKEAYSISIFR